MSLSSDAPAPVSGSSSRFHPSPLAAKVPEVALMFWVVKLLTTAGGEACSDFLGDHNQMVGAAVEILVVVVAVVVQFRLRRYRALVYWSLAFAIAITGTGVSDTLHVAIGIPYAGTTLGWAVVLAVVLIRWHRSEGTLDIHSVITSRRENFYWATVFTTFALGTALGDFTATVLHLGYLASGIGFAVVILIPALAWKLGANGVVCFWSAYVVTRPLGASFSDYISKSRKMGGVAFGDGHTAALLGALTLVAVIYLALRRHGVQEERSPVAAQSSVLSED